MRDKHQDTEEPCESNGSRTVLKTSEVGDSLAEFTRSCHDAIEAIYLSINKKPKYVLDADIAKCFDKINHEKLLVKLQTYPKLRQQIKAWLKSGVMDGKNLFPTNEGTPQGRVISPLLANIALHGIEEKVKQYANTLKGNKSKNKQALALIRDADDFVILHDELKVIAECQSVISEWLAEMGLELKPSKTKITHTLKEHNGFSGFDFLSFNIRQYEIGKNQSETGSNGKKLGFKTLITPSAEKVKTHLRKLGEIVDANRATPQAVLIKRINPVIRRWCNYYSMVVSKTVFSDCDYHFFEKLQRWAYRRHPMKNRTWTMRKYWHSEKSQNWVFSTREGKNPLRLAKHQDVKIVRYVKVKGERSPYDGDTIYWSSRLGRHPEMPSDKAYLLKRQKGKCSYCGLTFYDGDNLETDHIIPTSKGGKNTIDNKQLLHRHCHDQKTANDRTGTHDKEPLERGA